MVSVLFDLDGTLTDAREGIVACLKYALLHLRRNCPSDSELARFIGPPLQEIFRTLLGPTDPKTLIAPWRCIASDSLRKGCSKTVSIPASLGPCYAPPSSLIVRSKFL